MKHTAFVVLGFVWRKVAVFEDVSSLKALYCSIVRSILEYAVQVWSLYHAIKAIRIEGVQKQFLWFTLRRLPWNDPLCISPYEQRCQLISLETLASRRILSERMFLFDVLTICCALNFSKEFISPFRQVRSVDILLCGCPGIAQISVKIIRKIAFVVNLI